MQRSFGLANHLVQITRLTSQQKVGSSSSSEEDNHSRPIYLGARVIFTALLKGPPWSILLLDHVCVVYT